MKPTDVQVNEFMPAWRERAALSQLTRENEVLAGLMRRIATSGSAILYSASPPPGKWLTLHDQWDLSDEEYEVLARLVTGERA